MPTTEAQGPIFTHSVEDIAHILTGSKYKPDQLWEFPHVRTYLPILRTSIEEALSGSYGSNPLTLPEVAIAKLNKHTREDTVFSKDAVSWTVAVAILRKDNMLKEFTDLQIRFLLDAGLTIAVLDYEKRYAKVILRAIYELDPKEKKELLDSAKQWRDFADHYISFQDKLREQHSPSKGKEKKDNHTDSIIF